ncbi:MAG: hypothetical protein KDA79_19405 [Planctomycetaceae bacterium]|nr:hypothetical protein [Planctomycetaceae bacterium]
MDYATIRPHLEPVSGTTWRAVIDEDRFRLMGCQIAIAFETRCIPGDLPVPAISDEEARLADTILNGLESCIAESERLLENDPTIGHIRANGGARVVNPHIWISREVMTEDGPDRWTMVLGLDINPDFGWHIEFEGLTALEVWAGD